MSDFLLNTDLNIQKIYEEVNTTALTDTANFVTVTIPHTIGAVPDVRAWTRGTLFTGWKLLTDCQLLDFVDSTTENARGFVSADTSNVYIKLRPTSPSSITVTLKVRIYYND